MPLITVLLVSLSRNSRGSEGGSTSVVITVTTRGGVQPDLVMTGDETLMIRLVLERKMINFEQPHKIIISLS